MNKIGILSGGGKLPLIIGKKLIEKNYEVIFFCIQDNCVTKIYNNYTYEIISINSFTKILRLLNKHKIDKIIMAGNVKRPSLKDIKFDFNTIKLIKNYALDSFGDDKLLSSISIFFEKNGFSTLNWIEKCEELFINKKIITNTRPSKFAEYNKIKGLNIFEHIGNIDLAQSMIIQNKIVLGIEAAEGTDELIKRCFSYKKKGDKGILLKISKYNQSLNHDIPLIGLKTVKNLKKYDYEGVFLEKNKCIIIEQEKVLEFCNMNNIFISSIKKN